MMRVVRRVIIHVICLFLCVAIDEFWHFIGPCCEQNFLSKCLADRKSELKFHVTGSHRKTTLTYPVSTHIHTQTHKCTHTTQGKFTPHQLFKNLIIILESSMLLTNPLPRHRTICKYSNQPKACQLAVCLYSFLILFLHFIQVPRRRQRSSRITQTLFGMRYFL